MELLNLQNFSVSYDGQKKAVNNVSLTLKKGEILTIVGESGSGKSTLLHSVLGMFPREGKMSGQIRLMGQDLLQVSPAELRAMRGDKTAMIFQDTGRYMNPTARIGRQYTAFLKKHRKMTKSQIHQLQEEMFRKVHLNDVDRILHSYPFELSGGMRQRVGIAMAMSLQPELLLADEPTSALDVTIQAQVVKELLELREKEGTAIMLVTHSMGVAAHISDRIGVMHDGEMVELGEKEQVLHHPRSEYTRLLLESVIGLEDTRMVEER